MKELYEELKEARLSRNITLKTISEKTKIRLDFLEKLDEGDFSIAPMPYIRAFLKEYAETVGIDPNLVIQRLDKKINSIFPDKNPPDEDITADKKSSGKERPEKFFKNKKSGESKKIRQEIVHEKGPEKAVKDEVSLSDVVINTQDIVCEEIPENSVNIQPPSFEDQENIQEIVSENNYEKQEDIIEDMSLENISTVIIPEEIETKETEDISDVKDATEIINKEEISSDMESHEKQPPEQSETSGKRSTIEINEQSSYSTWIFAAFIIIITVVALIIFFINKG